MMDSLELRLEKLYTRGLLLPPSTPVHPQGGIVNYYELILFKEDMEGGVVIDGKFYSAVSGRIVCCKPLQHRKIHFPVRCYALGVSTSDPQLRTALDTLPVYSHCSNMEQLLELYRKLYYIPSHKDLTDRLALHTHLAAFLQLVLQSTHPLETIIPHNSRRHREVLLAADQYLQDHLEENVDLEALAKDSHLHPTYFHKLFTEAFGKSPTQQLMLHRLMASREYLRSDDCTIAEVARKCGFTSQNYFCRKFKDAFMETPSNFRKAIRQRRKGADVKPI